MHAPINIPPADFDAEADSGCTLPKLVGPQLSSKV